MSLFSISPGNLGPIVRIPELGRQVLVLVDRRARGWKEREKEEALHF
jgi:hypothetical protein